MLEKILDRLPWLTKLTAVQWLIAIAVSGMILGYLPPLAEAWFDKNYERNAQPRRAAVYTEIRVIHSKVDSIQTDTRDIKNILMSHK